MKPRANSEGDRNNRGWLFDFLEFSGAGTDWANYSEEEWERELEENWREVIASKSLRYDDELVIRRCSPQEFEAWVETRSDQLPKLTEIVCGDSRWIFQIRFLFTRDSDVRPWRLEVYEINPKTGVHACWKKDFGNFSEADAFSDRMESRLTQGEV
jgi:hypothetical protein